MPSPRPIRFLLFSDIHAGGPGKEVFNQPLSELEEWLKRAEELKVGYPDVIFLADCQMIFVGV